MLEQLKLHICEVVFVKANGQERTMLCTLAKEILGKNEGTPSVSVEDQITVWDIEAEAWRSFKPSKVISFRALEE